MNVSGISTDSLYSLLRLSYSQSVQAASQDESTTALLSGAVSGPDSTKFSKMSELFNKLEQLKSSDPDKFKSLMSEAAEKLKTAAQEQFGFASKMLSDLAGKFEDVANGGDISQLMPHRGDRGPGGPPPAKPEEGQTGRTTADAVLPYQNQVSERDSLHKAVSGIFEDLEKAISGSGS